MRLLIIALLTCQLAAAPSYVKRGYIVGETLYEEVGAEVVYHDDVEDWRDRVDAAGGSVSTATLEALDTFADAIETAGIRDKFYRLNVFAGDDLTTALVPFYVGPVTGGTEYGYSYDQNNGPFGSGDWAEDSGLTGDGSLKYLNTNLSAHDITTDGKEGHLGWHSPTWGSGSGYRMGAWSTGDRFGLNSVSGSPTIFWSESRTHSYSGSSLAVGQRTLADEVELYVAGSLEEARSSQDPTGIDDASIYLFARNESGTADDHTADTSYGYTIGLPMSETNNSDLASAWLALQAALGR
jgi:hypothetical protein